MLKGRRVLRSTALRAQPKTTEKQPEIRVFHAVEKIHQSFSIAWKIRQNFFHSVEKMTRFFHSVEKYFP